MTLAAHSMPRTVRVLILALTIFATLGLSVASAAHVDTSPAGCNICFVAHSVAFETPAVVPVHTPVLVGLATLASPVFGYRTCAIRRVTSRGPPYLSL